MNKIILVFLTFISITGAYGAEYSGSIIYGITEENFQVKSTEDEDKLFDKIINIIVARNLDVNIWPNLGTNLLVDSLLEFIDKKNKRNWFEVSGEDTFVRISPLVAEEIMEEKVKKKIYYTGAVEFLDGQNTLFKRVLSNKRTVEYGSFVSRSLDKGYVTTDGQLVSTVGHVFFTKSKATDVNIFEWNNKLYPVKKINDIEHKVLDKKENELIEIMSENWYDNNLLKKLHDKYPKYYSQVINIWAKNNLLDIIHPENILNILQDENYRNLINKENRLRIIPYFCKYEYHLRKYDKDNPKGFLLRTIGLSGGKYAPSLDEVVFELNKKLKFGRKWISYIKKEFTYSFSKLNNLAFNLALGRIDQESLDKKINDNKNQFTQYEINSLYDIPFMNRNTNPIYQVAENSPLENEYSVNLLWINLNPQDRVEDKAISIFGKGLDEMENSELLFDIKKLREFEAKEQTKTLSQEEQIVFKKLKGTFLYKSSLWADLHKGEINLWYDSALVTQKARDNTAKTIRGINKVRNSNIIMRDIRKNFLDEKNVVFFHPGVNVYFRIDLLKFLIGHKKTLNQDKPYVVVTDIDVNPMTREFLFDKRTLHFLKRDGYVFSAGSVNFENDFFILSTSNEILKINGMILEKLYERSNELRGVRIDNEEVKRFHGETVFEYTAELFKEMNIYEKISYLLEPRKFIVSPDSSFNSNFKITAHQREIFRFIGDSNVPFVRNGRAYNRDNKERPIRSLKNWRAVPIE